MLGAGTQCNCAPRDMEGASDEPSRPQGLCRGGEGGVGGCDTLRVDDAERQVGRLRAGGTKVVCAGVSAVLVNAAAGGVDRDLALRPDERWCSYACWCWRKYRWQLWTNAEEGTEGHISGELHVEMGDA